MSKCPLGFHIKGQLPFENWADIITVEVGIDKTKFYVHEGLLRHHSLWFRNRMNGNWGETKVIDLPQDKPDVFALFSEFVYRDRISAPAPLESSNGGEDASLIGSITSRRNERYHPTSLLAELYVFADMRQCPKLKCLAMDLYRDKCVQRWINPGNSIPYIYKNTIAGCGLRRFMVDWYVKRTVSSVENNTLVKDLEMAVQREWPAEFMSDVAVGLYKDRKPDQLLWNRAFWEAMDPCEYHDHPDTDDVGDSADVNMGETSL